MEMCALLATSSHAPESKFQFGFWVSAHRVQELGSDAAEALPFGRPGDVLSASVRKSYAAFLPPALQLP